MSDNVQILVGGAATGCAMSTDDHREHLDAEGCRVKAEQCRQMARADRNASHQTMLVHMAETWERMAKNYEQG